MLAGEGHVGWAYRHIRRMEPNLGLMRPLEIWFQIWFHPCLFLPTFAYCDRLEVTETKELCRSTVNQ
jgi:hypothetical protein